MRAAGSCRCAKSGCWLRFQLHRKPADWRGSCVAGNAGAVRRGARDGCAHDRRLTDFDRVALWKREAVAKCRGSMRGHLSPRESSRVTSAKARTSRRTCETLCGGAPARLETMAAGDAPAISSNASSRFAGRPLPRPHCFRGTRPATQRPRFLSRATQWRRCAPRATPSLPRSEVIEYDFMYAKYETAEKQSCAAGSGRNSEAVA
jgi:hypothetical protein